MDNVNTKKIVQKIQQLLNLSDKSRNNSDAEAAAALLKAQELMAKYDISVEQLDSVDEEEMDQVQCTHADNLGYRAELAHLISKNFKVKHFYRDGSVVFFGYKHDVAIAKEAFEFAYKYIYRTGNRICDGIRKQGYSAKGVFNSYALGFIAGMKEAFDIQCKALMIVTPKEVEDQFKDFTKNIGTAKFGACIGDGIYKSYYNQGIKDGKDQFGQKLVCNN